MSTRMSIRQSTARGPSPQPDDTEAPAATQAPAKGKGKRRTTTNRRATRSSARASIAAEEVATTDTAEASVETTTPPKRAKTAAASEEGEPETMVTPKADMETPKASRTPRVRDEHCATPSTVVRNGQFVPRSMGNPLKRPMLEELRNAGSSSVKRLVSQMNGGGRSAASQAAAASLASPVVQNDKAAQSAAAVAPANNATTAVSDLELKTASPGDADQSYIAAKRDVRGTWPFPFPHTSLPRSALSFSPSQTHPHCLLVLQLIRIAKAIQKRPPSQYASPAKQAAQQVAVAEEVSKVVAASPSASAAASAARTRRATRSMARGAQEDDQDDQLATDDDDEDVAASEAEDDVADVAPAEPEANSAATSSGTVSPNLVDQGEGAEAQRRGGNIVKGATSFIKPAKPPIQERRPPPAVKALQCAEKQRQAEQRKQYVNKQALMCRYC